MSIFSNTLLSLLLTHCLACVVNDLIIDSACHAQTSWPVVSVAALYVCVSKAAVAGLLHMHGLTGMCAR
jgi:membrane-anchored protein YejM (alkaline phosphatase superfamily)